MMPNVGDLPFGKKNSLIIFYFSQHFLKISDT